DIAALAGDAPTGLLHELAGGLFQHVLAAAADEDLGTQRQEMAGDRLSDAGSAAGDEDALAGPEIVLEHQILYPGAGFRQDLRGCAECFARRRAARGAGRSPKSPRTQSDTIRVASSSE